MVSIPSPASLEKLSGHETVADSTVMVEAGATTPEPSPDPSPDPSPEPTPGGLSRSLPAGPVAPDDEFTVTINNVGLADSFGSGGGNAARWVQLCGGLCRQQRLPTRLLTLWSMARLSPSL